MGGKRAILCTLLIISLFLLGGCPQENGSPSQIQETPNSIKTVPRETAIPANAIKVSPETDVYPPILHSGEYNEPIPMPGPINTAGGEDSAFITPDGSTVYFFFTPDVRIPAEKQLLDGATGIYVSRKSNGEWGEPERVILNNDLSLDGCAFVQGNEMWFCSARAGNYRGVDLWAAERINGKWSSWENAGEKINREYAVGEMHISADGKKMYFHSDRAGGKGGYDIWVMEKANWGWQQEPQPINEVNTPETEGWPFLSENGNELWFTRMHMGTPAIFRSIKTNGEWNEPELIVSQFAGEPTLDSEGNLYFTHHFYDNGTMLEADIYVAYKK